MVIANKDMCLYYDKKYFIDIGEKYEVMHIKQVIIDAEDRMFYMISNRYRGQSGFFLIRICEFDPEDHKFLMQLPNKL
jgi:hypothetical protein